MCFLYYMTSSMEAVIHRVLRMTAHQHDPETTSPTFFINNYLRKRMFAVLLTHWQKSGNTDTASKVTHV